MWPKRAPAQEDGARGGAAHRAHVASSAGWPALSNRPCASVPPEDEFWEKAEQLALLNERRPTCQKEQAVNSGTLSRA